MERPGKNKWSDGHTVQRAQLQPGNSVSGGVRNSETSWLLDVTRGEERRVKPGPGRVGSYTRCKTPGPVSEGGPGSSRCFHTYDTDQRKVTCEALKGEKNNVHD